MGKVLPKPNEKPVKRKDDPPVCPKHHEPLQIRRAGKGSTKGKRFWGCPRFFSDNCRYTIDIDEDGRWNATLTLSVFKAQQRKETMKDHTTHIGDGPPEPDGSIEGKLFVTYKGIYDAVDQKTAWLTPAGLRFLVEDDETDVIMVQDSDGKIIKQYDQI